MIEIATFRSEPETCEYLHDRKARQLYRFVAELSTAEYGRLLAEGWRRFGALLFQPTCGSCHECVPIRVLVDRFRPSKSQRRTWKRNADLDIEIGEPCVDAERLALHDRFHRSRAATHGWTYRAVTPDGYHDAFVDNAAPTLEFRYRIGDRLAAVGYAGEGSDALNSIYGFWEPDLARRGLGTYDILWQIHHAEELGKRYLYLGFLVKGCRSLEYKSGFHPHQLRREGDWRFVP
jgi:arginine-tRNA-protein transferase